MIDSEKHERCSAGKERWPGVDRRNVYIGNPNREVQSFERPTPQWGEGDVIPEEWTFVQAKMNNRLRWFGKGSIDLGKPQIDKKWRDEGKRRLREPLRISSEWRA